MQVNYPDMQLRIMPVTPFRQNCSVLWNEKTRKAIIVDAGGDADVLLDFLKKIYWKWKPFCSRMVIWIMPEGWPHCAAAWKICSKRSQM